MGRIAWADAVARHRLATAGPPNDRNQQSVAWLRREFGRCGICSILHQPVSLSSKQRRMTTSSSFPAMLRCSPLAGFFLCLDRAVDFLVADVRKHTWHRG